MNQKEMVDRRIELKTELARIAKHEAKIREELRPLEINILKELHASGFDAVKVGDHTISAKTAISYYNSVHFSHALKLREN